VGSIRHSIHKRELEKCFNDVLRNAERLNEISANRSQFVAKLDTLCERSDSDVSLLHNLVLLKRLASAYYLNSLENTVDDLIAEKKESLTKKLLFSCSTSSIEISKEK